MAEVREVQLPGIGVRLEFTTEAGELVGVILHRGGRRDLMVYSSEDPDVCETALHLTEADSRLLTEMLGGSAVTEVATAAVQDIEGLSIDWVTVDPTSSFTNRSLGEGMFRTRTGASIVAVIRDGQTIPAPNPEFVFAADDVAVAIGTPTGIEQLRDILAQ